MSYLIELTPIAEADIAKHRAAGNRKVLLKIDKLLNELRGHPMSGTGSPERLKHYIVPHVVKKNYGKAQINLSNR